MTSYEVAGICNLGVQGDKLKSFLFIFDGPLDNQLGSGPWPGGSRVGAAEHWRESWAGSKGDGAMGECQCPVQ